MGGSYISQSRARIQASALTLLVTLQGTWNHWLSQHQREQRRMQQHHQLRWKEGTKQLQEGMWKAQREQGRVEKVLKEQQQLWRKHQNTQRQKLLQRVPEQQKGWQCHKQPSSKRRGAACG
ncbi:golgin subfamily A member 6-like protein 7 isoform X2 [Strigops habroptila]|uniref:golgin subfamily A member 6-like protein 7 isoform X2 n=1 Tax=Strigops habroptila TaxID=2489341 RepID=UPI0011CFF893|nr:golgin subfamily A member 6-like protein 7 isoform X2 [Strigops habroptila]